MQVTLFAVLAMALLGVSGLAIDGGDLFVARRDAQALADGAARAGAAQIDEITVRLNPDDPPQIDTVAAAEAAEAYIADVRPGATLVVLDVNATHIAVRVTSPPVSVTLLQLAGVGRAVRVDAVGEASPQTGITQVGQ